MPRTGNCAQLGEYLIERVSDLAGRPVPRKSALAWLEVMAGLITVSVAVVIIRLVVK
jgi:hypothetical protein